jgi:hypothetical protein
VRLYGGFTTRAVVSCGITGWDRDRMTDFDIFFKNKRGKMSKFVSYVHIFVSYIYLFKICFSYIPFISYKDVENEEGPSSRARQGRTRSADGLRT